MLNPNYYELTLLEKREFLGSLIIAAETDFFSECCEIVNKAQEKGLFNKTKPLTSDKCSQIKDLDSPIENGIKETNY